jgi:uncharacterized protein (DUF362 family)
MNRPPEQPARSVVALEPVRGDVRAALRRCLEAVEWKRAIPAGAKVALKVNLGWDLFIPGSITSPLVAEALIIEMRDHVGKLYMVEADQVLEDIEKAFHRSGMAEVCRRTGVEWVNMSREGGETLRLPENAVLREITVPRVLREALLVTVPVMKTHAKTRITGALKNQWGCLPKMRHEYHLVLDDALADLNSVMRPALAVMDATVGLEGNGPKSGRPRITDRILCSTDPVALDTIQAISMGIDPASVGHLATCAARGIGTNDRQRIEVRGLSPERDGVKYVPARHNAVSLVETLLRRSALKKLFFNTPLFGICLFGAKLYYRAWSAAQARRHWRTVRRHPLYGPQWMPGWKGLETDR